MLKRAVLVTFSVVTVAIVGFLSFGIIKSNEDRPVFQTAGYVLKADDIDVKQVAFDADTAYTASRAGYVSFTDAEGLPTNIEKESFAYLEDGSVMALSGGVLFDFNDLSENFINNYYISAQLPIVANGTDYVAETTSGTITFGENIWKLSNNCYVVQSPNLTVHFADDDEREVAGYVQVSITDDGIVTLLTPENRWATISENCYIETDGGVKINPVTQLVNNNDYTISLAKLSVSENDNIVLTEDETRRQIVPELNIEAENGKDGEDGEEGVSGDLGAEGDLGELGQTGSDGVTGNTGDSGAKGAFGGSGAAGPDAVGDSSTNSALPSMSVIDWNVSATKLQANVLVSDPGGFLTAVTDMDKYPTTVTVYDTVTGAAVACVPAIYNEDNGTYTFDDTNTKFGLENLNDGGEFAFSVPGSANLEPDKSYRLVVESYYAINQEIFSRKFIDEIFYTDSTGVYLNKKVAEQSALTVESVVGSAYLDSVRTVEVVLLTEAQNKVYTSASTSGFVQKFELNYSAGTSKSTVSYYSSDTATAVKKDGAADAGKLSANQVLTFPGLESNTKYICRVEVATDSYTTLSAQELYLTTLKQKPSWPTGTVPTASYNRTTGQVDVFRPSITDPDWSAVEYRYVPYQVDENGNKTEMTAYIYTMQAQQTGAASFTLPTGSNYEFEVILVTDNNEKTVEYSLGTTEKVYVQGGSLPSLELKTPSVLQYDTYTGDLRISYDAATEFEIASNMPLVLSIQADKIDTWELKLTSDNMTAKSQTTVKTLNGEELTAQAVITKDGATGYNIALSLNGLLQNTYYTIAVTGYLDFDQSDAMDSRLYNIGSVSFLTPTMSSLNATWNTPSETGGEQIAKSLSLRMVDDGTITDAQIAHTRSQLSKGKVTIELRSDDRATPYGTAYITDPDDLAALYGDGLDLTGGDFLNGELQTGPSYSLVITEVADISYNTADTLGYYNTVGDVSPSSHNVALAAAYPSLTSHPETGVEVTPITRESAWKYIDEDDVSLLDLPEDAIIGYELQATLDNSDRIGKNLTYYVYEAASFYNIVAASGTTASFDIASSNSPVTPVQKITVDISGDRTIPTVALIFGEPTVQDSQFNSGELVRAGTDGQLVYYAGSAVTEGSANELKSGMARGYQYIFAYTAQVSNINGATEAEYDTYPAARADQYDEYRKSVGTGIKLSVPSSYIGLGLTYMLNSGIWDAPLIEPEFYTYVNETKNVSSDATTTSGIVSLHYSYYDVDEVIIGTGVTSGEAEPTKITWIDGNNMSQEQPFVAANNKVSGESDWYVLDMAYYVASKSSKDTFLAPAVDYNLYRMDYAALTKALTGEEDEEVKYLTKVPVERNWGANTQDFSNVSSNPLAYSSAYLDQNYLQFELPPANSDLVNRAYGMKLVFHLYDANENEITSAKKTFFRGINNVDVGYAVTVSTSDLGDEYIGKNFKVEAWILYDNGLQGWNLVDQSTGLNSTANLAATLQPKDSFAFQETTLMQDGAKMNMLGNYVGYVMSTSSPQYALQTQRFTASASEAAVSRLSTEKLRENIGELVNTIDDKEGVTNQHLVYLQTQDNGAGITKARNEYYLSSLGAMIGDPDGSNNTSIVPKGVSEISVISATKWPSGVISSVVPSIGTITGSGKIYRTQSDKLLLSSFELQAYASALANAKGRYQVKFSVYPSNGNTVTPAPNKNADPLQIVAISDLHAENSATQTDILQYVKVATDKESFTVTVDGNNGKFLIDQVGDLSVQFKDKLDDGLPLADKGAYFLVAEILIQDADHTAGKWLGVMDANTGAIYESEFYFAEGVSISSLYDPTYKSNGVFYENISYFDKYLHLRYRLGRTEQISVGYSIVSLEEGAYDVDTGKVPVDAVVTEVLTQKDMVDAFMMDDPTDKEASEEMSPTIKIPPGETRAKLEPGQQYYLRVQAFEIGTTEPVGTLYSPFMIPMVVSTTATIQSIDRSADHLTFQVTLNDTEHIMMGTKYGADTSGLYAVRFTDEHGDLITTTYDKQLFSVADLRKEFVLSYDKNDTENSTIVYEEDDLVVGGQYTIHIYAVPDSDFNGLSNVSTDTLVSPYSGKDWKAFFIDKDNKSNLAMADTTEAGLQQLIREGWIVTTTAGEAEGDQTANFATMDRYLSVGEKTETTIDPTELVIGSGSYFADKDDITFTLNDSYGVIYEEDGEPVQAFEKIEWTVFGESKVGDKVTPVSETGVSLKSNENNTMFTEVPSLFGTAYLYSIPLALEPGEYYIVVQLTHQDATKNYRYSNSVVVK